MNKDSGDVLVTVSLHDVLRDKIKRDLISPGSTLSCWMQSLSSVDDLILELGLQREDVGLIVINGRQSDLDTKLSDGDKVMLFSPMCGG
jgi:molybdopterin converting factor small subunit